MSSLASKFDASTVRQMRLWDVLAISCFDGRFIPRTVQWLQQETGIFDYRTEPGASWSVVNSLPDLHRLVNVVNAAVRFHEITQVWIVDHIDCMACGGSGLHETPEAEMEYHKQQLRTAKVALESMCQDVQVLTAYIDWDGVRFL